MLRQSRLRFIQLALFVAGLLIQGAVPAADRPHIRMATTTSTESSGLLDFLLPFFQTQTGHVVHVIAVGTGKALRMGREGDVDLVFVHARDAEEQFVREGYGEQRYSVMFNDFVIVGPTDDPAGISQAADASQALQRIAEKQGIFISRGDDSGTYKKEQGLWMAAGIQPAGSWYREAGQGMGKVLQIAGELDGYTLTDRGTWLAYKDKSPLRIGYEGGAKLHNPYGIIAVNPSRYPDINHAGAKALIRWLISEQGQRKIGDFTIAGNRLFNPAADPDQVATLEQASSGNTH